MNPLHLFEGFGVEIEYMIVSDESLDICPIADRIIHDGGNRKNDVSRGAFSWSNELVLHVLEMKCSAPVPDLSGVAEGFMSQVREINQLLIPHRARLLPSAMHPWMDPFKETHLWPHGNHEIYHCFDRIFDCRGHGWSNLQSTHLNLPFSGDDEFRRLHSAIRLVLPFIVAMAASSPFSEGSRTGNLCQRMVHYAGNCRKIPAITGLVVPDVYCSEQEYQEKVFDAIEAAIRPLDPEGILEPEWTNARGAIARFSRGAIEIRVMDTQEAPVIDLAILQFVVQWLKQLVGEEMSTLGHQESVSTNLLADQLFRCVAGGMQAEVNDDGLLKAFGLRHGSPMLVKDVLESILPQLPGIHLDNATILERICQSGSLAARILEATGHTPHRRQLHHIYNQLSGCLAKGHPFPLSQHP